MPTGKESRWEASGFRLLDRGGERPEDGEHRVEVSESRAEAVDEVGEGEFAVDEVLVVLGNVVGQLAHEGGVDLLKVSERFLAVLEDVLVAVLPALQFGDLAGTLVTANLGGFAGELQLLALDFKTCRRNSRLCDCMFTSRCNNAT